MRGLALVFISCHPYCARTPGTPVPPLARMRRMTRPAAFGFLLCLVFTTSLDAESLTKDVGATPGVQRATAAAREHLRTGRPAEAVAVLEAELLNADGNAAFLNLLRDCYTAHLRDLQAQKSDPANVESVR